MYKTHRMHLGYIKPGATAYKDGFRYGFVLSLPELAYFHLGRIPPCRAT
jgi:hypothetical protein